MKKDISIYDFFTLYQTNDDLLVLDVRNDTQFNEYHIPGSINYPGDLIQYNANPLRMIDKPYYVIDYNDEMAESVCNYLDTLGYDTICIYGGIKRWMGEFN